MRPGRPLLRATALWWLARVGRCLFFDDDAAKGELIDDATFAGRGWDERLRAPFVFICTQWGRRIFVFICTPWGRRIVQQRPNKPSVCPIPPIPIIMPSLLPQPSGSCVPPSPPPLPLFLTPWPLLFPWLRHRAATTAATTVAATATHEVLNQNGSSSEPKQKTA